jgi:hypothetical protein
MSSHFHAIKSSHEDNPMKTKGHATFAPKVWEEASYLEMENGAKLTKPHIVQTYTGDIEGEGTSEALMVYNQDRTASGVGLERFVGSLAGKSGTFVMQHTSTFAYPVARDTWFVVPGSATGELKGLRAEGSSVMEGQHPSYGTDFEYEFVDESASINEEK